MSSEPLVRLPNERRIFTLLRTHGSLTRADMARRLSLTPSTLTNIVDSLRERGLLLERRTGKPQRDREIGRPGVHVALDPLGAFFLGVEIGVGVIRFAVLDLALEVVAEETRQVSPSIEPRETVELIGTVHAALRRRQGIGGRLQAAVLTVPGLVGDDGFVVNLPILGWRDVALRSMAEDRLGVATSVENNANAAAFGEVYTRPEIKRRCVVYLKLGTGCGGAVILNGRLLVGAYGKGAEFGHVKIGTDGPRCSCGQRGCLEPNVTLGALARLMGIEDTDTIALLRLPGTVAEAAGVGDAAAAAAVDAIGHSLSEGVASLVNVFNPGAVILGGPMRPVIETALASLRSSVAERVVPGIDVPRIDLGRLGIMECAIGAATIAHHRALDISYLEVEVGV